MRNKLSSDQLSLKLKQRPMAPVQLWAIPKEFNMDIGVQVILNGLVQDNNDYTIIDNQYVLFQVPILPGDRVTVLGLT